MVHTFHCLGKVFLVDVESGSIYEIDALTEKLIGKKISPDTISEGEFLCYSEQEIKDAEAEAAVLAWMDCEYSLAAGTGDADHALLDWEAELCTYDGYQMVRRRCNQ